MLGILLSKDWASIITVVGILRMMRRLSRRSTVVVLLGSRILALLRRRVRCALPAASSFRSRVRRLLRLRHRGKVAALLLARRRGVAVHGARRLVARIRRRGVSVPLGRGRAVAAVVVHCGEGHGSSCHAGMALVLGRPLRLVRGSTFRPVGRRVVMLRRTVGRVLGAVPVAVVCHATSVTTRFESPRTSLIPVEISNVAREAVFGCSLQEVEEDSG